MANIYTLEQINSVLDGIDTVRIIEEGFVAYSQGKVVVPPVGELIFEDPPGEMHIKYGCIQGDEYYVVKIASGFYENYKRNLPASNGLMLVFNQQTGELACILLDEGYLTGIRTAAAGAVAAKYCAPKEVRCIGIFGAGIQGRLQVQYLQSVTDCKNVMVWGVSREELDAYKGEMESQGYSVETTMEPGDIAVRCNLIVTATPTKTPLLTVDQIGAGTHITAMGSDTPEKQELDPAILQRADIVVADSIFQSETRGEIYQAVKAGVLNKDKVVELGNVIMGKAHGRTSDEQITVVDLTGVAVQDIQISKAVYKALQT